MAIRKKLIEQHKGLPILDRYEVLDKIELIEPDREETNRDKALVAFLYVTACRISEVVGYIEEINLKNTKVINSKTKDREVVPAPIINRTVKGHPILKKQLVFGTEVFRINDVRSLKRKALKPRAIPVIVAKEKEFINIIKIYTDKLTNKAPLFPFTRQRASQILGKIGMFNHYLRHLRLTHLVTDYNFSAAELKQFVNWATSTTSDSYVHLNVENLIDKMRK